MEVQDASKSLLNKRVRIDYSLLEQNIMNLKKQNILNQMEILRLEEKSVIYENQEVIASNVVNLFKNRKLVNIMVISKTQSGKTGSMCACIKKYLEDTTNLIPIENIYIITGVSSTEWKNQTQERMPESIQSRVFHRCELPSTFVNEIKDKINIFIIMDEIQVAAKKEQTLYNTFKKAGILDKQCLYEKDIKILEYTATPDGTIYDLMKWNDASEKILAEVGEGYISCYDLYEQGRVKQYKELCGYNKEDDTIDEVVFQNIQEIKDDILNYDTPRYHIIRTKNGKEQNLTIDNFKHIFEHDKYEFLNYDKDSVITNINTLLNTKPCKHTFIFIKELLRCAKTLKKKHIGILYERFSKNPDDTVIIQGLVGRDTGYDNNGSSICYTNVSSIVKYEKLWNSEFNEKEIKWNSKTTHFLNGQLSGKNTFNDPQHYDGFTSDDSESSLYYNDEPQPIIKRKTFKEIKTWFNENLKNKGYGTGPKEKQLDEGFYRCITQFDKEPKVRSIDDLEEYEKSKNWGFRGKTEKSKDKNKYRVYPVYQNITDKNSLEWWLVYY